MLLYPAPYYAWLLSENQFSVTLLIKLVWLTVFETRFQESSLRKQPLFKKHQKRCLQIMKTIFAKNNCEMKEMWSRIFLKLLFDKCYEKIDSETAIDRGGSTHSYPTSFSSI